MPVMNVVDAAQSKSSLNLQGEGGGEGGTRTPDPAIMSRVL